MDRSARELQLHQRYGEVLTTAGGALDPLLRRALNRHVAQGAITGLLVHASDGGGSALAAWLAARKPRPGERMFVHHVGASVASRAESNLLRRLLLSLAEIEGLSEPLPSDQTALRERLGNWLARASAGRRLILVITALDALDASDVAAVLDWLPGHFPGGVRLLIGAASDAVALIAAGRGFASVRSDHASDPTAAGAALSGYSPALLCALWASRDGLTAGDLDALGLPSPESATCTEGVRLLGDRLVLVGASAQDAVWRRYLGSRPAVEGWHRRLADVCSVDPEQRFDEQIWQLLRAGDVESLRACVLEPMFANTWLAGAESDVWIEVCQALDGPNALAAVWAAVDGWSASALLAMLRALRAAGADAAALSALAARLAAVSEQLAPAAHLLARLELLTLQQDADTGALDAAARQALELLVADCSEQLGVDAVLTRRARHALAMACEQAGALDAAIAVYRATLAARERTLGQHPAARDLLPYLLNLAAALKADNRLDEARALLQRGLGLVERQCGPAHPLTASVLDSLAGVLYAGHDLSAAEDLYRRALAVSERAFGATHPATAAGLHNLATVLDSLDRHLAAEPLLRRALAIRREVLGNSDADTASTLHNLAGVLTVLGRQAEAEPMLREARETWSQLLGDDHPATAATINNLADLLRDRGDWAEAESLYLHTLGVWTRLLGEEHRHAIMTRVELAGLYLERAAPDDAAQAVVLLEAVLAAARALGATDTTHLDAVVRLASAWRSLGRRDAARALLTTSLRQAEAGAGLLAPGVQRLRRQLEALDIPVEPEPGNNGR